MGAVVSTSLVSSSMSLESTSTLLLTASSAPVSASATSAVLVSTAIVAPSSSPTLVPSLTALLTSSTTSLYSTTPVSSSDTLISSSATLLPSSDTLGSSSATLLSSSDTLGSFSATLLSSSDTLGSFSATLLLSSDTLVSSSATLLPSSDTLASSSAIPLSFSATSLLPSTSLSTSSALPSGPYESGSYVPIPYHKTSVATFPPPRKDIDTMSKEELVLFVLAMQQWQKVTAGAVGGYFQVASIHGAPHQYWDNAGDYGTTDTGDKGTGYCFHGDQNFYLWHRPYVALFEQQMRAVALNISATWYAPQRATYQAAAASLRLPYWDWAKSGTVPVTIANSSITVVDSTTGQEVDIANPLYSHTLVSDGDLGTTYDGSTISVGPGGSRTTFRKSTYLTGMQNVGASLKKNTALLFNTPGVCWNVFATYNTDEQTQCPNSTKITSLEGIHNTVHNTIAGTMADLDVSAYDPIFWLHHCNVDRLGAIWQAINPNTTVQTTYGGDSTFVVDPGSRDETFTFLPFRASQGDTDWWQVNECYDVRTVGYTYPEIADQPIPSIVLGRVNAIYGTGRTQQAISSTLTKMKRADGTATLIDRQAGNSIMLIDPPSSEALIPYAPILISANGSFHEYSVACTVQKSVAPGTSFDLHLFFGNVKDNDYLNAPNRVGGFSVSQAGGSSMDHAVSSIVSITDALLNKLISGAIKDLEPDTVQKYVLAKMIWRLVTTDDKDIGGDALSNGLALEVQHTIVTPKPVVDALPIIAAPDSIANTTNNTQAKPLPSGIAAAASLVSGLAIALASAI